MGELEVVYMVGWAAVLGAALASWPATSPRPGSGEARRLQVLVGLGCLGVLWAVAFPFGFLLGSALGCAVPRLVRSPRVRTWARGVGEDARRGGLGLGLLALLARAEGWGWGAWARGSRSWRAAAWAGKGRRWLMK